MIAFLEGEILIKTDKFVILNVNGLGYKVFCSESTLDKIKENNQKVKLYTHYYIKENIAELYGFTSFEEMSFFELLISVSGIGPKTALAILSAGSIDDLKASIASGQTSLLSKVSGVGKSTAERIILELRKKIQVSGTEVKKIVADDEALEALISLGYSSWQARQALNQLPRNITKIEDKIKAALKILSQK